MHIIPVIDLSQGHVVHAVRGQRELYQPLQTQLCRKVDPFSIVQAYRDLYPFQTIYIADLDAINGTGDHESIINSLAETHDSLEFWVDRGITNLNELIHLQHPRQQHIVGTETGINAAELTLLKLKIPELILSLDFINGQTMSEPTLLQQPDSWTDTIISMNLDRVGSGRGPNLGQLVKLKNNAGSRRLYAAGGIRDRKDLELLKDNQIDGVLIASALHSGVIRHDDLITL